MMRAHCTLALAILAIVSMAQSDDESPTTSPPSPTTSTPSETSSPSSNTTSSEPQTITIAVGASAHRFTEAEVFAEIGDVVEFVFYPANHSVVRAPYRFPCEPYEYHGIGRRGFFSGPKPVQAITNDLPRYQIRVNDTEPIFYFCGAEGSCYKHKMIGVINPNDTQTLGNHLEAAEGLTFQVLPGEQYPDEAERPDEDEDETTPASNPSSSGGNASGVGGLDGGQIAGIVIGSVAVAVLAAAVVYLCGRRGGLAKAYRRNAFTGSVPPVSEANFAVSPQSPGMDNRWSATHWSTKLPSQESWREQRHSPPGITPMTASPRPMGPYGFGVSHLESQLTGNGTDPRMSQSLSPPPPGSSPPGSRPLGSPPVELPSTQDSALSPAADSLARQFSWSGKDIEADYHPPTK